MAAKQWWSDERARAELQAAWNPSLEAMVQGCVYDNILRGASEDEILRQIELLQDVPDLIHNLQALHDRLEYWLRYLDQGSGRARDHARRHSLPIDELIQERAQRQGPLPTNESVIRGNSRSTSDIPIQRSRITGTE